ncbi:F0F1 ATP synthase subunit B [Bartonella henselae]|uniref:F0F1 ATP synthase subunit B n=1 Tax=Bartonella henselae TaxID=38323 RepID=UPI00095E5798|nr:F0F1 ATP synthase subunit B [Bartonella henselae]OLL54069.1 ATP F0F1 synthase subunit B' [Bartonella henselae]OLL54369.1 ATP F0F1 synthase subunit B' [Bartonella henselae]UJM32788.1 F0F1 ATP synthase subunit B [Bartonella henselae]
MFISSAYAQNTETPLEHIKNVAERIDRVFPPFDFVHFGSHLFWLAISFGLFYLFISRVIVPRIGGVIETRRDRIASDLDQAMRMKQEADIVVETYERKLAQARSQAHVIAQTASEEIKQKVELERKEIEANLEKKLTDAEKQIAKIRDKAMKSVDSIAEEVTLEIVKKLIDVDVSKESVRSAVKTTGY